MSLKFLAKKSWHTTTLGNVERVWLAEQKEEKEKKKMEELQKQIIEERQVQELRQLQAGTGAETKLSDTTLDWMYQGPQAAEKEYADEYLLGKTYKGNGNAPAEAATISDAQFKKDPDAKWMNKVTAKNDVFTRMHEDPMLMIKQKEKAAKEAVLNNPAKMARLLERSSLQLLQNEGKSENKERHSSHKHRSSKHKSHKHKKHRSQKRSRSRSGSVSSHSDSENDISEANSNHRRIKNSNVVDKLEVGKPADASCDRESERSSNSHRGGRGKLGLDLKADREGNNKVKDFYDEVDRDNREHRMHRANMSGYAADNRDHSRDREVRGDRDRDRRGYSGRAERDRSRDREVRGDRDRDRRGYSGRAERDHSRDREVRGDRDRDRRGYSGRAERDRSRDREVRGDRDRDRDVGEKKLEGYGLVAKGAHVRSNDENRKSLESLIDMKEKKEMEEVRSVRQSMMDRNERKKSLQKLSAEEKQRRLAEMQSDATVNDTMRTNRMVANHYGDRERVAIDSGDGKEAVQGSGAFLQDIRKEVYSSTDNDMAARLQQNKHYIQRGADLEDASY